jgi:hypothetical protein
VSVQGSGPVESPETGVVAAVAGFAILVGLFVWYPVNGVACMGDTVAPTGTPQADYCNAHLHYVALLLPGLVVTAAGSLARHYRSTRLFVGGCIVGFALAISPAVLSAVLAG